ncbi:DUF1285 domain-containing protein [Entomobacter blattae]|uniref:DUF1285 domain-containing protein n=1 Tax=Entomobacter blattae TaxID=2762277 RepID=A0A7H1NNC5_9PROT|nr:DUF1285 domain-containing protein [Entomobacter blattae]QNT77285.1 hypothetical protein JGUZn3_00180 [Entomobacter blattae]
MTEKEMKSLYFSFSSCTEKKHPLKGKECLPSKQKNSSPVIPAEKEKAILQASRAVQASCLKTEEAFGLPPEKPEKKANGQCRLVLPFSIKRDGNWYYKGKLIKRKHMVCLFSSLIERDEEGDYWLETPTEKGIVVVEDVPFVVTNVYWTGYGRNQTVSLRTNIDQMICVGPDHPLIMRSLAKDITICGEEMPYLFIRKGMGKWPIEARISRLAYYELLALSVPGCYRGEKYMGIWSQNMFFPLTSEDSIKE